MPSIARVSHQTRPLGQFGTLPTLGPPEGGPEGHSTGGRFLCLSTKLDTQRVPLAGGVLPAKLLPGERLVRFSVSVTG